MEFTNDMNLRRGKLALTLDPVYLFVYLLTRELFYLFRDELKLPLSAVMDRIKALLRRRLLQFLVCRTASVARAVSNIALKEPQIAHGSLTAASACASYLCITQEVFAAELHLRFFARVRAIYL